WGVFLHAIVLVRYRLLRPSRTGYKSGSTNMRSQDAHEFSFIVFAVAGRSLPAQSSHCDGAADADAGREGEFRAAAAERGILQPARDAGWFDHRRSLAGDVDRTLRLAHWPWGHSDELPEALLMQEPMAALGGLMRALTYLSGIGGAAAPANFDAVYVIREGDLEAISKRFTEAKELLRMAMASVWDHNTQTERDEYLRRLSKCNSRFEHGARSDQRC